MSREPLDAAAIADGLSHLDPGWSGDASALKRAIEFADFATAVEFVGRLAPFADEMDHHPDLNLSWRWVRLELSTHSSGGVTELDLQLAAIVDEVAAGLPLA
jgi:4a-hydroxytetrahydrobiopterin dehydratase